MRTNIPAFRLPAEVLDEEIDYDPRHRRRRALRIAGRRACGRCSTEGFDAVFVGSGAPKGKELDLPGPRGGDHIHIGIDWLGIDRVRPHRVDRRARAHHRRRQHRDGLLPHARCGSAATTSRSWRAQPRQFFKASAWELEDAEEERVEIVDEPRRPSDSSSRTASSSAWSSTSSSTSSTTGGEIVRRRRCSTRSSCLRRRRCSRSARRTRSPGSSATSASSSTGTDVPVVDPVTFQSTRPGVFFGGDAAFGPEEHHLGGRARA